MLIPKIITVGFLTILFLQSGIDKVLNLRDNYNWLKEHFVASVLNHFVKPMLITITILELTTGLLSAFGGAYLFFTGNDIVSFYGVLLAAITIILLFFGQRVAKDYEGAVSLAVYFILTLVGLSFYY